jgi:hypothetical protein
MAAKPRLDRVTITGADDSVTPADLVQLSKEFPFVEWGILASESSTGRVSRFPSWEWMVRLQAVDYPMQLSLHLCGRWVRQLLLGHRSEHLGAGTLFKFQRVQLNFHAEACKCAPREFAARLREMQRESPKAFIFQIDGAGGNSHLDSANEHEVPGCFALFDVSGGAGILPEKWPEPIYLDCHPGEHGGCDEQWDYHGYAGGLGPDNLKFELPKILDAAAGTPHTEAGRIWIDMESKVRSDNDRQFDLDKVHRCLEIASGYVSCAGGIVGCTGGLGCTSDHK